MPTLSSQATPQVVVTTPAMPPCRNRRHYYNSVYLRFCIFMIFSKPRKWYNGFWNWTWDIWYHNCCGAKHIHFLTKPINSYDACNKLWRSLSQGLGNHSVKSVMISQFKFEILKLKFYHTTTGMSVFTDWTCHDSFVNPVFNLFIYLFWNLALLPKPLPHFRASGKIFFLFFLQNLPSIFLFRKLEQPMLNILLIKLIYEDITILSN